MDQHSEGPTPAKRPNNGVTQEERNEDKKLVKWFCKDLGPYWILDNNGCRDYFKELIPNYALPSKKKFLEELIPKQYKIEMQYFWKTLQSVDHVAITIDTWKYPKDPIDRERHNMWSWTVHYVHDRKFYSQILYTILETQNEEILRRILHCNSLLSKVVCFVSGHEKNDNLLQFLNSFPTIPHLFCAAATLNLIFQDCYNYLTINEELKEKLTKDPKSSKKKKDKPFCWHNQYTTLQNISENATGEEKTELVEYVNVLKPLADLADALSKMQYTTLSSIIPLIVGLKFRTDKYEPTTNRAKELQKELKRSISSHFEHYKDDTLARNATFLDPRFTKAAFKEIEKIVENKVIEELHGPESGNPSTSSNHIHQTEATPSTSYNLPEEKQALANANATENLFAFLDDIVKPEGTNNETSMIVVKEINVPKLDLSDDPFKFWDERKSSSKEYKKLSRMSQKYLCIPATAIPAESISGR